MVIHGVLYLYQKNYKNDCENIYGFSCIKLIFSYLLYIHCFLIKFRLILKTQKAAFFYIFIFLLIEALRIDIFSEKSNLLERK